MMVGNLLIGLVILGVLLTALGIWLSYKFLKPD